MTLPCPGPGMTAGGPALGWHLLGHRQILVWPEEPGQDGEGPEEQRGDVEPLGEVGVTLGRGRSEVDTQLSSSPRPWGPMKVPSST